MQGIIIVNTFLLYKGVIFMCTAATYKTKDFYFGRNLDYDFSYGDEVTITPRNFELKFREEKVLKIIML